VFRRDFSGATGHAFSISSSTFPRLSEGDETMAPHVDHVEVLDKKITELSYALAHLGKGTELSELIRIIKGGGWTTPAEFAFTEAIIDSMQVQVKALSNLNMKLLAAGKLVATKELVAR
jgi:hypothetical protein